MTDRRRVQRQPDAEPAAGVRLEQARGNVSYREWAPPLALASHVACLWACLDAPPRVLPDGCVDLVWTGADVIAAGPATLAVVPRPSPAGAKLGVRLRIGAAATVLGMPAGELVNLSPRLREIWPSGHELEERVAEAVGAKARLAVLSDAVATQLTVASPPEPIVRAAVVELRQPRIRMASLSAQLGISDRQLRRRFEIDVGYSPSTLARVLRLQRFLTLAGRGDLARLAAEAATPTKPISHTNCRRPTGLPPAALLAIGATPAGERHQASLTPPSAVNVQ